MRSYFCVCWLLSLSVTYVHSDQGRERCLIVFTDDATDAEMEQVKTRIMELEGDSAETMGMGSVRNLIKMIYANITKQTEQMISSMPGVSYMEEDGLVFGSSFPDSNLASIPTETSFLFGESNDLFSTDRYNLDVLNSEVGQCGNGNFVPLNRGTGVDIYILDSGINYEHDDFRYGQGEKACDTESRAKFGGYDAVDALTGEDRKGADCFGHGTHTAGVAAGLKSGVAKDANLWSIRVLNCFNSGSYAGIISGMDYVMALHANRSKSPGFVGSVVNLSLAGPRHASTNNAANNLVKAGVVVVTASGNNGIDACLMSPGSANDTINVGAFDQLINGTMCRFVLDSYSNYGDCVDIVAPGREVLSALCFEPNVFDLGENCTTTTEFFFGTGTSTACPHVSGTAALLKKFNPNATPQEIKSFITSRAADDIIRGAGTGSSKRLHLF